MIVKNLLNKQVKVKDKIHHLLNLNHQLINNQLNNNLSMIHLTEHNSKILK